MMRRLRATTPAGGSGTPPGPGSTRMAGRVAHAMSALRDVNRRQVRPEDLIVHQGFAVLATDRAGAVTGGKQGFFLHQTRYLSRFGVEVDGQAPTSASAGTVEHHSLVAYHLAPSPAGAAAGPKRHDAGASAGEVARKAIELQVAMFVGGGLHIDLVLTNHGMAGTEVTLGLDLTADFADLNEVLAGKRQQDAPVERVWTAAGGGGALHLRYTHPELDLRTTVRAAGGDAWFDGGDRLFCRVRLDSRQTRLLSLDVVPFFEGAEIEPVFGVDGAFDGGADPARARRLWVEGCTGLDASDPALQSAWDQAVSDLASLQVGEEPGPAMMVAGMPNYSGLFGRDGFVTALQTACLTPEALRATLQVLPSLNATDTDDFRDAQPGKVLHQRQRGPLARLGMSPFLAYYGDQSTPGLFMLAAARHFAHTGDAAFLLSIKDHLARTLDWMDTNRDAAGFYPYQTRSSMGVRNQSWKDSGEAVLYPDGTLVDTPIAMADIQALYYAGQAMLGQAFAAVGAATLADRLTDMAAMLKQRFNARFWMPEQDFLAMALDPAGRQVGSVADDAGACLAYGILDEDKTRAVADRLMAPDMFSGWGIRTLSAEHPAFNPFAYHLGTVWPFSNSVAAFGFRRYGFQDHLHRLVRAQLDAAQVFDLDRLPEVFGGHARDARHPHPGLYSGACSPQAWSAGAVIQLVELPARPLSARAAAGAGGGPRPARLAAGGHHPERRGGPGAGRPAVPPRCIRAHGGPGSRCRRADGRQAGPHACGPRPAVRHPKTGRQSRPWSSTADRKAGEPGSRLTFRVRP